MNTQEKQELWTYFYYLFLLVLLYLLLSLLLIFLLLFLISLLDIIREFVCTIDERDIKGKNRKRRLILIETFSNPPFDITAKRKRKREREKQKKKKNRDARNIKKILYIKLYKNYFKITRIIFYFVLSSYFFFFF